MYGLFETMRSYNNKIVYLNEHLKRLNSSCGLIGIKLPYPAHKLKTAIRKAARQSGFSDNYLRLTLWKSGGRTDISIIAREYKPCAYEKYKKGFRVLVSKFRQNENSLISNIKTTNRLLYELAYQEARIKKFDEAIILNGRGYIAEASRSNIFFVKDSQLFTPALQCGCLGGITRKVIFDLAKKYGIPANEGNFTLGDLCAADEAFLTNSLIGVMPLACVKGTPIGSGGRAKLSSFLSKKYTSLLK